MVGQWNAESMLKILKKTSCHQQGQIDMYLPPGGLGFV